LVLKVVLGLGLDSVGRGLDAIMLYTGLRPGLCAMECVNLGYLFERILAVPVSLAPVERVFFKQLAVRSMWASADIVRQCQTSCSSHCVCQVFHLQLTGVMVNVRAVAWLIL